MYRAIPTSNKICFDKDLKRSWRIHQQKLKRIKGSVGKEIPQHFHFLDQRPKKAALEEVRNIEIEKENHVLLSKIKNIGEKGCKNSYAKLLDQVELKKRTLNQPFRKRQLVKIVEENQEIMKRIQSKKSMYNTKKWDKQRKEIEKNITLISAFPYKNYPSTQTQVNLWMTEDDYSHRKTDDKTSNNSRIKLNSLAYEGTQKINESYYLVLSYLSKKQLIDQTRNFYIEVENLENSKQKYQMQMEERQALKLLREVFDNNVYNLLKSLQVDADGCFLKYQLNDLKKQSTSCSKVRIRPCSKNRSAKSPKKLQ